MVDALPIQGDEWHALRLQNIGGSEVAALFGQQPDYCLSHYALWMVKAGKAPPPPVDNPRTKWGLALESAIAQGAAEQEGWKIEKGGYVRDPQTPGMGCTLDFTILEPGPNDNGCSGPGVLEIKNVDWMVHRRTWVDDEPPLHILLQLQHQLACTGRSWGAIGGLVGGNNLQIYRFKARPTIIAQIRTKVTAFWQSIRDDAPPPVDGSDGAAAILRAMYPELHDDIADLTTDNELPEICAGYLSAAERRKAAEKDEAAFKNRLVEKMGDHIAARAQGFTIRTAVTAAKESVEAPPGYMIPGRKQSRRYTLKEAQA